MKQIMLDNFRRRGLVWMMFVLVHFVLGICVANAGEPFPLSFCLPALMLGQFLWYYDFQRGYLRVALSLPLTARQIGRIFWWLSVGFATLLTAVFSGLGVLTAEPDPNTADSRLDAWLVYVVANGLSYGASFWLSSGGAFQLSTRSEKQVAGLFYNFIFWACIIGGTYYLMTSSLGKVVKGAAFCLVGIALTILGWFRAEEMIVDYGESRSASQPEEDSSGQFKVPTGRGGILFMLQTAFARVWGMGLWLLVVLNVFHIFSKRPFDWPYLTIKLADDNGFMPFMVVSIMAGSIYLACDLRLLRTMPISAPRLAAVLHAMFILPLLTFWLAIAVLAGMESGAGAGVFYFKIVLLAIAPASVLVAGFVWNPVGNSEGHVINAGRCIVVLLGTFAPVIYQLTFGIQNVGQSGLPWWFVLGFPIVISAASFWATIQFITKSSGPYHVSSRKPAAWGEM